MPFGERNPPGPVYGTVWNLATAIWVRKTLPYTHRSYKVVFTVDDNAAVYWNGTLIQSVTIGSWTVTIPETAVTSGTQTLAIRAVDTSGGSVNTEAQLTLTGIYGVVSYTLDFELATQDRAGMRDLSLWNVYCNDSYVGQASSPNPINNTVLSLNDVPPNDPDNPVLWRRNLFALPNFDPAVENHINTGYVGGGDYGYIRKIRVTGNDGSVYYGEYPKGYTYGLVGYTASGRRGGMADDLNNGVGGRYWTAQDGDYDPAQWDMRLKQYVNFPVGPSGLNTGEAHFYFTIPTSVSGWTVGYVGAAPVADTSTTSPFPLDSPVLYWDSVARAAEPATGWQNAGYDDSSWSPGWAYLANSDVNTTPGGGTYYEIPGGALLDRYGHHYSDTARFTGQRVPYTRVDRNANGYSGTQFYARATFQVATAGTYHVHLKGDNGAQLYLDGASIMSVSIGDVSSDRVLTAGSHTIAWHNQGDGSTDIGAAWVIDPAFV